MKLTHIVLIVLAVLLAIDWLQTLQIAANPTRWRELNPVLGPHPTRARVSVWFAVCSCALAGGAYLFWSRPDTLIACAVVAAAMELVCVVNNYRHGIRV